MKLKKNLTKLIALLLSTSLSFSACGKNNDSEDVLEAIKESIAEFIEPTISPSTEEPEIIEDTKKIVTDELTLEYLKYFDSLNYSYKYENLYITEDKVNEIIESSKNQTECTYVFVKDIDSLVNNIANNTSDFINIHSEYRSFLLHEKYQKILKSVLNKVFESRKNDLNEDAHKLSTISIVFGSTSSLEEESNNNDLYLAYYNDELNAIIINSYYVRAVSEQQSISYETMLAYLLEHELNHVFQTICDCRKENGEKFNNIAYDKYASFILESSAESSIYNQGKSVVDSYTYDTERSRENEILMLGLLNNNSINEYYNSIFDNDPQTLYNFLNLSEDEIYDFYKILYCIDGTLCRNDLAFDIYDDTTAVTYGEIKREIGYAYKENLFKMMIKRLLIHTATEDITLTENLTLYNLVKALIIEDCYSYEDIDGSIVRVYDEDTINNINFMDEQYINYLSQKYRVDVDEIRHIERVHAYVTIITVRDIVEGKEAYETYEDDAQILLDKYPLLYNIIKNNHMLSFSDYERCMEDNNIKTYVRSSE